MADKTGISASEPQKISSNKELAIPASACSYGIYYEKETKFTNGIIYKNFSYNVVHVYYLVS